MKKLALAAMLILSTTCALASPDTLRLFYPIDKYQLSDQDKLKIKGIIDSITKDQPVTIKGYADYLGSRSHNLALSRNRGNAIKAYMLSLDRNLKIAAEGEGQVPGTVEKGPLGEPHDRRADIIFSKVDRLKKAEPANVATVNFSRKIDSLSSLDVGKSISLDELMFEGGRHVLESESEPYLRLLTRYLAEHKNLYFEIRGHICCEPKFRKVVRYVKGHDEYVEEISDGPDMDDRTERLSLSRAKAIYDHFVQNGIDTARMTYTGVGASQPKIDPEVTESDRQRNRRVEIIILKR